MNKAALIETLDRWIRQRPGLEPALYIRDWSDRNGLETYRRESRSITKDLRQARTLLAYVETRDSITAQKILDASTYAAGGRLKIQPLNDGEGFSLDYCVGQYWPTEYRRAVCLVLASAIWDYLRENMPPANGKKRIVIGSQELPDEIDTINGMTPGDYLRKTARRELGRQLSSFFE